MRIDLQQLLPASQLQPTPDHLILVVHRPAERLGQHDQPVEAYVVKRCLDLLQDASQLTRDAGQSGVAGDLASWMNCTSYSFRDEPLVLAIYCGRRTQKDTATSKAECKRSRRPPLTNCFRKIDLM